MFKHMPYKPPMNGYKNVPVQTENKNEASDSEESRIQLEEAIKLHKLGTEGDKEAVKKCYELLKMIHSTQPGNYLAEAYFGSATSLLGRDEINPNQRFKLAMKGLKLMDNAVSKQPDNIEIRLLRGQVCYRLPEMYFHRTATALEDFDFIISTYEKDANSVSDETYRQVLFNLGGAYKNLNRMQEAENVWRKLLSIAPESKYVQMVRQEGIAVTKLQKEEKSPQLQQEIPHIDKAKVEAAKKVESGTDSGEALKKKVLVEGLELHSRAFSGGREDVAKASEYFEKLYNQNPGDSLIAAYYADCLSLMGREAREPSAMFGSAIRAIKMLDSAVNGSPDNIEIRLLRANQSYRLPESFFKRTATAINDFEYLIGRYENDNSLMTQDFYYNLLYLLGKSYQRIGMESEAETIWKKLLSISGNSKYKGLANKELNNISDKIDLNSDISRLDSEALLNEAIRFHDLAVEGKQNAAAKACGILEKLYKAQPNNPIIEGYYGSSIALMARDSSESQVLFDYAIKGIKHLKNAVTRGYGDNRLKFLRANVFYNLPEVFFHLTDKAAKDFKSLITAYENDNSLFSEECYWQMLYDLGVCYERLNARDKAKKTWQKLLNVSTDPKYRSLLGSKMEGSDG
ncbi:MAG: tetratricopeptide repeat protein [Clostridia bacterium]|nr:tetratricopeptide repeat protein [Clostridia bacterium]